MARQSYGSKDGKVRSRVIQGGKKVEENSDDVVRRLKKAQKKPTGEDYRERSLSIHGTLCARCGMEFHSKNMKLLTVHHKDGNHQNNPADGSNWENLCVYCHDDMHSRGELGEYLNGAAQKEASDVVYSDEKTGGAKLGTLADLFQKASQKKRPR